MLLVTASSTGLETLRRGRNTHPTCLCRHGQRPLGPEGSYLMGGLKVWIDYGQVVGLEDGP